MVSTHEVERTVHLLLLGDHYAKEKKNTVASLQGTPSLPFDTQFLFCVSTAGLAPKIQRTAVTPPTFCQCAIDFGDLAFHLLAPRLLESAICSFNKKTCSSGDCALSNTSLNVSLSHATSGWNSRFQSPYAVHTKHIFAQCSQYIRRSSLL